MQGGRGFGATQAADSDAVKWHWLRILASSGIPVTSLGLVISFDRVPYCRRAHGLSAALFKGVLHSQWCCWLHLENLHLCIPIRPVPFVCGWEKT